MSNYEIAVKILEGWQRRLQGYSIDPRYYVPAPDHSIVAPLIVAITAALDHKDDEVAAKARDPRYQDLVKNTAAFNRAYRPWK